LRSLNLVTLVDILNFTSYLLEHLSVEAAARQAIFLDGIAIRRSGFSVYLGG
jgi:hypothetical protein